jgi:flavodoxin
MKSLIICKSIHVGNTEKIAKRMSKVLQADLIEPKEFDIKMLREFDLIGFGSGIYDYKHHRSLLNLVDKLPNLDGKKVFVFSTSGVIMNKFHDDLKQKLERKNAVIVDEFFCKGFNKNSFLKYLGGMNKGRPNEADLISAEAFVLEIKKEVEMDTN